MKTRVTIELEIETDIDQHPEDYVGQILDSGDLQDLIEDRDESLGQVEVTSAMVGKVERIGAYGERPYTVVGYLNSWNVAVGLALPRPFVEHIQADSVSHAVDLVKQAHRDEGKDSSEIVEVFEGTHDGKITL
jgi:hypothetical protein